MYITQILFFQSLPLGRQRIFQNHAKEHEEILSLPEDCRNQEYGPTDRWLENLLARRYGLGTLLLSVIASEAKQSHQNNPLPILILLRLLRQPFRLPRNDNELTHTASIIDV